MNSQKKKYSEKREEIWRKRNKYYKAKVSSDF